MKKLICAFALAAIVLSADPVYPEPGNPNPPYGAPGTSMNPFAGMSDWIYAQWNMFQNMMFGGPTWGPPPNPLGN